MAKHKNRRRHVAPGPPSVARDKRFNIVAWRLPPSYVRGILVLVTLSVAVGIVYSGAMHAPMVFDDDNSVAHNPSVKRLWPLIGDAEEPGPLNPQRDYCTAGRPLVNLTLAINYHFSRFHTFSYHAFSIVCHVLSGWLLWAIVARTLQLEFFHGRFDGVAEWLALVVALVWSLHPLQTEAVIYITQRTELMMALFYFLTMYASLRYWNAQSPSARRAWLVTAGLACSLGATCKEVIVSAPVMVLLFERTFIAGSFRRALRESWPLYVALFLSWLPLLALNLGSPRSESAGFHLDVPAYAWWLTQCKVLMMYWKLCLWPWPLVIHYEFPYLHTFSEAWPWLVPVVLVAVLTVVLAWRRSAVGYALTWMFAILSPTLVIPIITEIAAERRMYLPLASLAALAVVGGYRILSRAFKATPATSRPYAQTPFVITAVIAGLVLIACGSVSARRAETFNNTLRLWEDALRHQPQSPIVQMSLGMELATRGRPQEAIPHLEEAVRLRSHDGGTYNNLGFALLMVDRPEEALARIDEAIERKPDAARAYNNRGLALAALARNDEAMQAFRKAIEVERDLTEAQVNLGVILARSGQRNEAIGTLEHVVQVDPEQISAYAPLATCYLELGKTAEALTTIEKAISIARDAEDQANAQQFSDWLRRLRTTPHAPGSSRNGVP